MFLRARNEIFVEILTVSEKHGFKGKSRDLAEWLDEQLTPPDDEEILKALGEAFAEYNDSGSSLRA